MTEEPKRDLVLEALEKFRLSDEYPAYLKKLEQEEKHVNNIINKYVDWFHTLTPENRLDIIRKINTKYDSDEYYYRETGMGYEPRKPLYDLLYEYGKKYGEKSDDVNGFFPEFKYVFENVEVSLLIGQGSIIHVLIKE